MHAVWLGTFLLVLGLMQSAVAEPQPVLFMWESNGWGSPAGPYPYGLRFVVYDDGKTLYSPDPEEALRDKTPAYYMAMTSPANASALTADALKQISGAEHEIRGDDSWSDRGWTTIQIWNAGGLHYDRYDAYGHPCLADGRTFDKAAKSNISTWATLNRQGTDQRFLKLCDMLSRYSVQGVEPWKPKAMWVSLIQKRVKPDKAFSWPADWPMMPPAKDTPHQMARVCISLSDPVSTTTANLVASDNKTRNRMFNAGAKAGDDRWWVINSWGFSLPGEINLADSVSGYPSLAEGNCVAR